jgi:hypothetical protein
LTVGDCTQGINCCDFERCIWRWIGNTGKNRRMSRWNQARDGQRDSTPIKPNLTAIPAVGKPQQGEIPWSYRLDVQLSGRHSVLVQKPVENREREFSLPTVIVGTK